MDGEALYTTRRVGTADKNQLESPGRKTVGWKNGDTNHGERIRRKRLVRRSEEP
jgi:hypothetical protein